MSKHTLGPWEAQDNTKGNYEFGIYSNDATGSILAQVGGFRYAPRSREETEANARLIAAAPDLLEACMLVKKFLAKLEDGTAPGDPLRGIRARIHAPLHAALDAAIAKAEGRS